VSFLAALSPEARDELRGLVQQEVRKALRDAERSEARREWLTTEQVAELVSTTANGVRCRLRRGWLDGDVAKDGRRLLVRRSAVLDWLDSRSR
jgi:hypothetical protein